jgi:hypothetical protein
MTVLTVGEKKANVKWRFGNSCTPRTLLPPSFLCSHLLGSAMPTPPPTIRSAGVTAAATVSMLGSISALLVWGWFFQGLLALPRDTSGKLAIQSHPFAFLSLALVPPLLIAMGLRMAVGMFQLKPWARKSALLWAAVALTFSLSVIAFRPYETFVIPERFVGEAESLKQLLAIGLLIFTLPISVWWIFYFTRPNVKLQFQPENPGSSSHGAL